MNFDFPLILTLLVLLSGGIALIDFLFFARRRKAENKRLPFLVEQARAFFPVFLLVWIIRSFIVQPYRVPTGSLEPTVMPGDFIVVNQFAYGLRLPVLNKKIMEIGEPKIGDIALFRWPVDPSVNYVKRVVGLPGDRIVYKKKQLIINGKLMPQTLVKETQDMDPARPPVSVYEKIEDLAGVKHAIFLWPEGGYDVEFDIVVPKDMYFMMGDNRDNSLDSRKWGFVPENHLIGKAFGVWMSWDATPKLPLYKKIRWDRIGKKIN